MQALCQWDVQKDELGESLAELLTGLAESPDAISYATELVATFWRGKEVVDERLARASPRWDLDRMSPVERNVMRVAIVEMLGGEVPAKVAIDEAIEVGKEYGGEDSPRFINGMLNEVYQAIRTEAAGGK